jgi:hypothetical protein
MIDDLRNEIRQEFQRDLDKLPPPAGLLSQAIHFAVAGPRAHERARVRRILSSLAVACLLLAVGVALFVSRLGNQTTPAGAPRALPSSAIVQPSPSCPSSLPSQGTGCLSVTPASGPVGTVVSLDGAGCSYSGQPTYLAFENGEPASGTVGALDIPNIATDSSGHFHIALAIPKDVHSLQGQGGGAVRPGRYTFVSLPGFCSVTFEVTP